MNAHAQTSSRHVRSISYAPESIQPWKQAKSHDVPEAAWILCRKFEQSPIADGERLIQWAELGRVRPGDYLVSTRRDQCIQARDVAELDAIFRTATARRLEIAARVLALAGLVLGCLAPLLGSIVLFAAIATTVVSMKNRPDPARSTSLRLGMEQKSGMAVPARGMKR